MKDIAKEALSSYDPKVEFSDEVAKKLDKVISTLNDLVNIAAAIPQIALHADTLIDDYKKYAYLKIAIGFKKLQKAVNNVLIKKNESLARLLKNARDGVIDSTVKKMVTGCEAMLDKIEALNEKFQEAYQKAMDAISSVSGPWKIGGEEMGFLFTVRSMLPTHKPGKMNVAFSMDANTFGSGIHNVKVQALDDMIDAAFPPLTNAEWFLSPGAFKARALFSDQNGKAIKKVINAMSFLMSPGAQYLPKWKDLSLLNPWYDIAMLRDWGPTTKEVYGLPLPQ